MAAKAWGSQQKAVEEVFFQNEAVSLCLLINRRARTMRVIDFRAGPTSAKRLFVLTLAQREGVEKVYTLVERDEVATWVKLGFAKEGNIPGFYKRSDAFLLGCTVPPPGRAKALERAPIDDVPSQSEIRLTVAEPAGPAPMTAAQETMEKTILTAKKGLKDFDKSAPAGQGGHRRRGRGAQGRGHGAAQRSRAHRVRAVRPRRRAPLLRRDRARRLRALRVDRVAVVLRQRVPRAPAVAQDGRREAGDHRRPQGRSATACSPRASSAASRSPRATTSRWPRPSSTTASAAPACWWSTSSWATSGKTRSSGRASWRTPATSRRGARAAIPGGWPSWPGPRAAWRGSRAASPGPRAAWWARAACPRARAASPRARAASPRSFGRLSPRARAASPRARAASPRARAASPRARAASPRARAASPRARAASPRARAASPRARAASPAPDQRTNEEQRTGMRNAEWKRRR